MEKITQIGIVCIAVMLLIAGAIAGGVATGVFKGEQGDKGDKGDKGDSIVGPQGPPGPAPTPLPPNNEPIIELITQSGSYVTIFPSIINSCKYTYNIVVGVEDVDEDDLKVQFYWADSVGGPWTLHETYFNGNGEYGTSIIFKYTSAPTLSKTLFWLVEAWDGQDITTEIYSYTIKI